MDEWVYDTGGVREAHGLRGYLHWVQNYSLIQSSLSPEPLMGSASDNPESWAEKQARSSKVRLQHGGEGRGEMRRSRHDACLEWGNLHGEGCVG